MSDFDFDYGAELAEGNGAKRVNPEVGKQFGRLKAVIHLGKCENNYGKTKKDPVNKVCLVMELKGNLVPDDDEENDTITGLNPETGEPIDWTTTMNLTKGDNAALTKLMSALISKKEMDAGTIKGFDQLIGRPLDFEIVGSEKTDDDGKPKYYDIKNISMPAAIVKSQIPELKNPANYPAHCKLPMLTVDAVLATNMFNDVQMGMMKSEEWKAGTHPAIALVEEIRKTQPKYATATAKSDNATGEDTGAQKVAAPTETVDPKEEF